MTDQPWIAANPDGGGVILHLPEITYLDTQTWAVDIGLTADGLASLRTLLTEDGGKPPSRNIPPCQHCGKTIRRNVYYELHGEEIIRAWHTDRPDCWTAALRDGSSR